MLFPIANYYYNFGFNVTCIKNEEHLHNLEQGDLLKSPCHEWEKFTNSRQDLEELRSYEWEKATGVGVVLGYNNLRAIDVDECKDYNLINYIIEKLDLPEEYQWIIESGSRNGFHILFYSDEYPFEGKRKKVRALDSKFLRQYVCDFKRFELRWAGHLVLPPSTHSSNFFYRFFNNSYPFEAPLKVERRSLDNLLTKYFGKKTFYEEKILGRKNPHIELPPSQEFIYSSPIDYYEDEPHRLRVIRTYSRPFFLFFDTETNGLPSNWKAPVYEIENWPRLVQLGWVLCDSDGNEIAKNENVIKPKDFKIPQEAAEIHGITNEYAQEHGCELREVLYEFGEQCAYNDSGEMSLIAHNIDFDKMILGAEFLRVFERNPIYFMDKICTMKGATDFCALPGNYGYKWPKLNELYHNLFGEEFVGAHNALADVEATARCFFELKKRGVF